MPSRTWIVTRCSKCGRRVPTGVSMPSRAWIVTSVSLWLLWSWCCFNALTGLNCYDWKCAKTILFLLFQCPHGLELLLCFDPANAAKAMFQCPHGLELLLIHGTVSDAGSLGFNALTGLNCYSWSNLTWLWSKMFQCPHGLELLLSSIFRAG